MKRRRHKLEVSTFPFLAVLLCAMGSLILLLLVIDRRARAVATAKAMRAASEAARLAEEHDAAHVEARRVEMERRKRALHALLLQQDQSLRDQIQKVKTKADTNARQKEDQKARLRALEERLAAETARLAQRRAELDAKRKHVTQTEQLSEASRKELVRMSAELAELENTLAALKLLRQRDTQLFSVVPYRGKRGDNRKPIYLECASTGLIFHPDRLTFTGGALGRNEVRAEVERRIARFGTTPVADGKPAKNAYLLMLIRPDGITTYYEVQDALHGFDIDFGYEFIDSDWVLDFPEDGPDFRTQPWMANDKKPTPTTTVATSAPPVPPRPLQGLPHETGGNAGIKLPAGAPLSSGVAMGSGGSPSGVPGGVRGGVPGTSPGAVGLGGSIVPARAPGSGSPSGVRLTGGTPGTLVASNSGTGIPGAGGISGISGGGVNGGVPGIGGTSGGTGTGFGGTPGDAGTSVGGTGIGIGGTPGGIGTSVGGTGIGGTPGGTGTGIGGTPGGTGTGVGGTGIGGTPGSTGTGIGGTPGGTGLPGGAPGASGIGVAGGTRAGQGVPGGTGGSGAGNAGGGAPGASGTGIPGGTGTGGSPVVPGVPSPFAPMPIVNPNAPPPVPAGTQPRTVSPGNWTAIPGAGDGGAGGSKTSSGSGGDGSFPLGQPAARPGAANATTANNSVTLPRNPWPSSGQPGNSASGDGGVGGSGSGSGGSPSGSRGSSGGTSPSSSGPPSVPGAMASSSGGSSGGTPSSGGMPPSGGAPSGGTPSSGGMPPSGGMAVASGGAGGPSGGMSRGSGAPGGGHGSGGSGDSFDVDPLNKLPGNPGAAPRGRVPIRPGWLNKNRDWVIPIECQRDCVILTVTHEKFKLEQLSSAPDNPLAKAVTRLIDSRQRMVPPDIPPWRPILQFQVHQDGSRAYFYAFPALDRLEYAKIRENLDLDEMRKKEQGR